MKSFFVALLNLASVLLFHNLTAQPNPSIYNNWEKGFTKSLQNTHDMALPAWGPYSDKFNGISHVPRANNGIRFDVIVQPSFYLRNNIVLANTQRQSNYHPWEATPDLSYFSYRYELEWKDRVYCDVSFSKIDDKSRLIKAEFVNNTTNNRSLALNIFSSIIYPYSKRIQAILPDDVDWLKAAEYVSLTDSVIPANYNLVYNGQLRGQVPDENAVSQTAVVTSRNAGERITYNIPNTNHISNGVIVIRFKNNGAYKSRFRAIVNGKLLKELVFKSSKDYVYTTIETGEITNSNIELVLQTLGDGPVTLDGMALIKKGDIEAVSFKEATLNQRPKLLATGLPNAAIFKFDNIDEYYGFLWSDTTADRRVILDSNPDDALAKFDNLVKAGHARLNAGRIAGNNKGWFENVFSVPIVVKPAQKVCRYAIVVCGDTVAEVAAKLKAFNKQWNTADAIMRNQQVKANLLKCNSAGKPYLFGYNLLVATALTNLNYPVFAGNKYFKHTTPGKRWSSFYTWDSGFIGLGYTDVNLGRAVESLNAYTMDTTEQSAYLEHGTPLPVQAYLFNELWNKTQNVEYLRYFYPRLKRWYNYLGGAENSPTRNLKSGLIQTWNVFYNSGGWDDYSAQVYTHSQKLEKFMAPTINTSHQIRFAKILRAAAVQLGNAADVNQYNTDIANYSKALQQYAWDKTSGYFGYVNHDNNGNPIGILKHESGRNFNMGVDGCSPLIAGICTPRQQQAIISHLFTKGQLWSDQGITAIDQSAPYYDKDGYWNGRVWMPHQWFIWKTMFDLNEPEKAVQIAKTALNVWKRETDDTYNCWENFSIESGNGGGWHQFGALSSPVINWFNALFKPGTVTYGLNMWCTAQKFYPNNEGFKGDFKLFADAHAKAASMLFCLNEKYNYQAKCNGQTLPLKKVMNGLFILRLAPNAKDLYHIEVIRKS